MCYSEKVRNKEKNYRCNMEEQKPRGKKGHERDQGLPQQTDPSPLPYFTHFLAQSFFVPLWHFPASVEYSSTDLLHC